MDMLTSVSVLKDLGSYLAITNVGFLLGTVIQ
jgi:hypothetical protein